MITNFLKIAFRNLLRHKGFSAINIFGLALGMASASLILLWIYQEVSYDDFHANRGRLYQVYRNEMQSEKVYTGESTPKQLSDALLLENPDIAASGRMISNGFIANTATKTMKINGSFADPSILKMFSFPLVSGNADQALSGVNSIVLTEKLAHKLFGNEDPINKVLALKSYGNVTVTGILKDLPENSQFTFEYLLPFKFMESIGWNDAGWNMTTTTTYVLLQPGARADVVSAKIKNTIGRHYSGPNFNPTYLFLHPINKWRLYSRFENGISVGGRIETVRLFGIIAGFLLLIACINFMNLSTARSEKRAKEVGVRKVAGASHNTLVLQFLGESVLLAVIAGVLAFCIVWVSLPFFSQLIDQSIRIPWNHGGYWIAAVGFILLTGLLAGSYPAFYFSAFKPVSVLKGTFKRTNARINPRKVLVVTQFTFAITLIISTLIVQQQLRFAQQRERGYAKNNSIYYFSIEPEIQAQYNTVKAELLRNNIATSVTKTGSPLTDIWNGTSDVIWPGKTPGAQVDFDGLVEDGNLVKTAGLKLIAGRDIDLTTHPMDSFSVILNQSAVKAMQLKDPVGQTIFTSKRTWNIVGVIQDVITRSPYEATSPMIIFGPKKWTGVVNIAFNPSLGTAECISRTQAIFEKYNIGYPFEYFFLDESYAKKFSNEKRIGTLGGLFAGLTIFISCLGLFGLATFMATTRRKEVGIRKVLGASAFNITTLLSKDFLVLVVIALMLASPVAWYATHSWLERFTYHITIGWEVFLLAGGASLLIACCTVSYQAIHAALANPAKSMRFD